MKKRILVVAPNLWKESFFINDYIFALHDMGYECHVVTRCPSFALVMSLRDIKLRAGCAIFLIMLYMYL